MSRGGAIDFGRCTRPPGSPISLRMGKAANSPHEKPLSGGGSVNSDGAVDHARRRFYISPARVGKGLAT
jgi:hypothetical protein